MKLSEWAKTQGMDRSIGRQLYSILSQAGLKSVNVFPIPIYRTQEDPEQLRMFGSVPVEIINTDKTELLEQGVFTEEEYNIAMEEFEKMLVTAPEPKGGNKPPKLYDKPIDFDF